MVNKLKALVVSLISSAMLAIGFSSPAQAYDFTNCGLMWFEVQRFDTNQAAYPLIKQQDYFGAQGPDSTCSYTEDIGVANLLSGNTPDYFNFSLTSGYTGTNESCAIDVKINNQTWLSGSAQYGSGQPGGYSWYLPTLNSTQKSDFLSLSHLGSNSIAVTSSCPGYFQGNRTLTQTFRVVDPSFDDIEGISIDDGAEYSNSRSVDVYLSFDSGVIGQVMISNDGGFAKSKRQVINYLHNKVTWSLNSSVDERMVKTVYVKYKKINTYTGELESRWSQTLTDDIILDTTAPTLDILAADKIATQAFSSSAIRKAITYLDNVKSIKVKLKAKDNKSGVSKAQVNSLQSNIGATTVTYRSQFTVSTPVDNKTLFIRVQDRAGNWSKWKSAKIK